MKAAITAWLSRVGFNTVPGGRHRRHLRADAKIAILKGATESENLGDRMMESVSEELITSLGFTAVLRASHGSVPESLPHYPNQIAGSSYWAASTTQTYEKRQPCKSVSRGHCDSTDTFRSHG